MVKITKNGKKKFAALGAAAVSVALVASFGVSSVTAGAYTTTGSKSDFYSVYGSKEDVVKAGNALNEEICEEGFVLMKNNGVLPLPKTYRENRVTYNTKISIFGKASTNLLIGGSGSGSGNTAGAATIKGSLEAAGYEVNNTLWNWYSSEASGENAYPSLGGDQVTHGMPTIETETETFNAGKATFESSLSTYKDAAIVVFARQGGEGIDLPTSSVKLDELPANPQIGDTISLSENGTPVKGRTGEGRYLDHYLQLDEDEENLLTYVKSKFEKVIVVINSSNTMEIADLEKDEGIDGIVWVGGPGNQGMNALGRLLAGDVNFSGRTVDLYVDDFSKIPAVTNFGEIHEIGSDNVAMYVAADTESGGQWVYGNAYLDADGKAYLLNDGTGYGLVDSSNKNGLESHSKVYCKTEYEEDIYVGYRYWETAAADLGADGESWYSQNVVYPFGYGLSYTEFSQEVTAKVKGGDALTGQALTGNETLEISVKVTNKGNVAGKDVVQLYVAAPYDAETAPIAKASNTLIDFGKTKTLAKNESQTLTFEIKVQDLASYDWSDANSNNHKGYELDKGDYTISAMKNSHESYGNKASATFKIDNIVNYDTDSVTGNTVENRFVDYNWGTSKAGNYDTMNDTINLMNRAEGLTEDENLPKAPTLDERKVSTDFLKSLAAENKTVRYDFTNDTAETPWYVAETPAGVKQEADGAKADREVAIKWKDMIGVDYDDPKWDTFLNQFTWDELTSVVSKGSGVAASLVEHEGSSNKDGPSTIATVSYASECVIAATFNKELANEMGTLIGEEALWNGTNGWYAPAMNIHRTPFSGRNFEYYSEDPILSGYMAANTVSGAESKGLRCYIKHFAMNDCETDKSAPSLCTYASEQTIREIYLKPFEMAIELGGASGIMTSFNRIGSVSVANHWVALNGIARGEWGFDGCVVTDAYVSSYMNIDKMYRAGGVVNLWMSTVVEGKYNAEENVVYVRHLNADGAYEGEYDIKSPTQLMVVRQAVKDHLYTAARSNEVNKVLDGVNWNKQSVNLDVIRGNNLGIVNKDSKITLSVAASTEWVQRIGGEVTCYEALNLPAGLTLDKATGLITGTPTVEGDHTFTVRYFVNGWIVKDVEYDLMVLAAAEATNLAEVNAQIKALQDKVAALEGADLTEVNAQIKALQDKVAALEGADDVDLTEVNAQIKALQEKVAALEEKDGGCNGTISATTGIAVAGGMILLACAAGAVIHHARKKED